MVAALNEGLNMNPADMLRIVDSLHREKAIDKEIVFQAIESALITAAKKYYGELEDVVVAADGGAALDHAM